jgi:hypothetical protein
MRSVGLKTLKNKLSEYVRIARAGETVLIIAIALLPRKFRHSLAAGC